jgi:hypothetical protein
MSRPVTAWFVNELNGDGYSRGKKSGIDPAQSSSIILTTATDAMGFLAFFGLVALFQGYLL